MDSLQINRSLRVGTLREFFLENFYTTLRVYKNVSAKGPLADDNATLGSIMAPGASFGNVYVDPDMRVGDFEKMFANAMGIGVQVANANNTELLDNDLTFNDIAKPYLAKQARERAAQEKADRERAAQEEAEFKREMAKLSQQVKEDKLYKQYEYSRQEFYHQGQKFIRENQNVSVKDFSAYYYSVLVNSREPRENEFLKKLASKLAPQISSAQRRAKMDGKVDMRIMFRAERERLEKLFLRNPEYRNDINIRANFPDLADKADLYVVEMKKAEKYQPLFVLLCIIYALFFCLPLIFEGVDAIVILIILVLGAGLYFFFKKFGMEKCSDWNLVHIWKRFMANRKNK